MACNCLCCGCQSCSEAQEGKCCCGGPSGTCCQPGEYCCSGVCLPLGCTEGGCGLPEREVLKDVDGEQVLVLQIFYNGEWIDINDRSILQFGSPDQYGTYCAPFYCDALSGFCVWAEAGLSNWMFNYGPGYGRVCPTCPAEPEYTFCCNNFAGCDGPTPAYGIVLGLESLVVPPGATCAEWCNCSGPFMEWRYDVDNDPTFVQDCDQCIDWCSFADGSYVLTGRDLNNTLIECNRVTYVCDAVDGCKIVRDTGEPSCPTCIAFCDPSDDCSFVAYADSALAAGSADYEPCDECNPLP